MPWVASNSASSAPSSPPKCAPRRHADAADQTGTKLGGHVPVQVGHHQDVETLGRLDQLHAQRIDDAVIEHDLRVVLGHAPGDLQEEAVGELHDVGLVARRDLRAPPSPGFLEREPDDALTAEPADGLDRDAAVLADASAGGVLHEPHQLLDRNGSHLELEAGVHALGVLADHDQVDLVVHAGHPRIQAARTDVGVQISVLRSSRFVLRRPLVTGV